MTKYGKRSKEDDEAGAAAGAMTPRHVRGAASSLALVSPDATPPRVPSATPCLDATAAETTSRRVRGSGSSPTEGTPNQHLNAAAHDATTVRAGAASPLFISSGGQVPFAPLVATPSPADVIPPRVRTSWSGICSALPVAPAVATPIGATDAQRSHVRAAALSFLAWRSVRADLLKIMWSYVGRAVRRLLYILKCRAAAHFPGAETSNGGDCTGFIKKRNEKPKNKQGNDKLRHKPDDKRNNAYASADASSQAHDATFVDKLDGEDVTEQDIADYAEYCRAGCSLRKKIICHMCVFDKQKFYSNMAYPPSHMLLHCSEVHENEGLECYELDCRVRFSTERERKLHRHFFHKLTPGWWEA